MDSVAIYINGISIYWSQLLLAGAIITGYFLAIFMYAGFYHNPVYMIIGYPLTAMLAVFLSRTLYWYCHMEQYKGFASAFKDASGSHYLILGILLAVVIFAAPYRLYTKEHHRYELLDSIAPVICFLLAAIRLDDLFLNACVGKFTITNETFQMLPFAVIFDDGSYHMASFLYSFIMLSIITVFLFISYINGGSKNPGYTFHRFLILLSGTEIFIDSTRFDASHIFFPGKALEDLNKGAGFMGISQMAGALICIYLMIFYTVKYAKYVKAGSSKNGVPIVLLWIVFLTGVAIASITEYKVQRHSSQFVMWYGCQISGILLMMFSLLSNMQKSKKRENVPA